MKILFLIKENGGYGEYSSTGPKSGLLESAKLTSSQLTNKLCIHSKISICIDGNSIDKELYLFKPDICIIEALWVTPIKILELTKLHPKVKFVIRIHSEITFLSMEGISIQWIKEYTHINNVCVAFNSSISADDFNSIGIKSIYLPNIYLDVTKANFSKKSILKSKVINIGCFGSIRPLKNQLLQAVAAIQFGDKYNKEVHFHINASRIEQKGESALRNMRALFEGTNHRLIEYKWLPRESFLSVVKLMDIGLQVSLSESFNIISADFVFSGIPIIVSTTIDWMPSSLQVENDVCTISSKIFKVLNRRNFFSFISRRFLSSYNYKSLKVWKKYLKSI